MTVIQISVKLLILKSTNLLLLLKIVIFADIIPNNNRQEWTQLIITKATYSKKWWKTYTYVTKNHLYNPVKQSRGHAYRIKRLLSEFRHLPIVSIVVFTGDAVLNNVESLYHVIYEKNLLSTISEYKTIYLSDEDVNKVVNVLEANNIREEVSYKQHVKNLRRVTKETNAKIRSGICPKCGGHLIMRKEGLVLSMVAQIILNANSLHDAYLIVFLFIFAVIVVGVGDL